MGEEVDYVDITLRTFCEGVDSVWKFLGKSEEMGTRKKYHLMHVCAMLDLGITC